MKKLMLMTLMLVALLIPATQSAECFDCKQFQVACQQTADDYYTSCMDMCRAGGGTTQSCNPQCLPKWDEWYGGCMTAHGCPIIY